MFDVKKPLIIAEIGWNHMGNMKLAKKMIIEAKKNGADFVKFQTWSVSNLKDGSWDNDGRRRIYIKAELTKKKHEILKEFCVKKKIKFLTSVFNEKDINWLSKLSNYAIKIPSHEVYNIELIKSSLNKFKHVIILEEHSNIGGLATAISEIFLDIKNNNKFLKLNLGENFIVKSGKQESAIKILKLSSKKIKQRVVKFIQNEN